MNRRTYLVTASSAASALLAGCTIDTSGERSTEPSDDPAATTDDSTETAEPDTTEDSEEEATSTDREAILTTVDAYFEAATQEDLDAIGKYMHSAHPFNPDNLDEAGKENIEFEYSDAENYESKLVETNLSMEKVRNSPSIRPWFEDAEVDPDDIFAGEEAALVQVRYDSTKDGEAVQKTEQFIMLTDDGSWRVFFPYEAPVEIPDGEPVETEKYQVVDDITYNTESERAKIFVSDLGDIEAQELVAYSTSLQIESGVWSNESRTLPDVNYFTSSFDPSGDEIVVSLRMYDGEEKVVYRDQYQPESGKPFEVYP